MSDLPADILVIDDERQIRRLLNLTLTGAGYHVRECENGQLGLSETALKRPDAIILDLGLPDINGLEVLKQLREWTQVPILILTAWDREDEKVDALDAGADDYLTKPFSVEELLARVRVTLRRLRYIQNQNAESPVFTNGELTVDYSSGCVYLRGQELHLTPSEYKLLCLLARNVGKVLTHTAILKEIWGSTLDSDVASLRVFMTTLRKKLEKGPGSFQYIQTHVGVGYRMLRVEPSDENRKAAPGEETHDAANQNGSFQP